MNNWMKKREGSEMKTTLKTQKSDKNIISYTKLVGRKLLIAVTHSALKLMYQPSISRTLLFPVGRGKELNNGP